MGVIIKPKRGRPPKYTRSLAEEICITIMQSNKGTKRLCLENPHWPCQDTLFTWIKNDYEFSEQYKAAKMMQFYDLADEIWEIAENIELETEGRHMVKKNRVILQRAKLQISTRVWIASRLVPRTHC